MIRFLDEHSEIVLALCIAFILIAGSIILVANKRLKALEANDTFPMCHAEPVYVYKGMPGLEFEN